MTDTAPAPPDSPTPAPASKIAAQIRQAITGSSPKAGVPAPLVTALSRRYGDARATCGRAPRMLQGWGLAGRLPGLG